MTGVQTCALPIYPKVGTKSTTTYYLTFTDSLGVISTDSITIYVDTNCCKSWALIGSDPWYCYGDTVYLANNSFAGSGATYQWDFGTNATPGSFTGATPPPVIFDTSGVFQIRLVLNDSCGTDTAYHDINIYPLPNADAGNDTSICDQDTVSIGSIPVSYHSYSWFPASGLSDSSIANPNAYIDSTITYVLIVTDDISGCTATDSITITVDTSLPVINIAGDTIICKGDSAILTADRKSVV